jgi:hypothetical protein
VEADIRHEVVAAVLSRHDLHDVLRDHATTCFQEQPMKRLDDPLRAHGIAVAGNQHAATHRRGNAGEHLAQVVGSERLARDALPFPQPALQGGARRLGIGFPDMDLPGGTYEIGEILRAQQFLPAQEGILVQRAHGVRDFQHARHAAGRDPAHQPG